MDLIEEPPEMIKLIKSNLTRDDIFSGLAFVNQVKSLSNVDCNLKITVSVSEAQMQGVSSSA